MGYIMGKIADHHLVSNLASINDLTFHRANCRRCNWIVRERILPSGRILKIVDSYDESVIVS